MELHVANPLVGAIRPLRMPACWTMIAVLSASSGGCGGRTSEVSAEGTSPTAAVADDSAADGGALGAAWWLVPGPCTYACSDPGACAGPCAAGQVPASCEPCPEGWTARPESRFECCLETSGAETPCYDQATVGETVAVAEKEASCFTAPGRDGTCGCTLPSVDGHSYAIECTTAGCSCIRDGQVVKTLPSLCPPAATTTMNSSVMNWVCGFPPM